MRYRKPREYIPPYDYCDRWCERCRIDKTRCLVYQVEMDDHLHREIDGKGEPTPEEAAERLKKDLATTARMVRDQAERLGVDLEKAAEKAGPPPPRPDRDPLAREARGIASAVAAFLREHGRAFAEEANTLRRYLSLPFTKLRRAAAPAADEVEEADRILQAQVAHRALVGMSGALDAIRRRRPGLGDGMLDLLAAMERLRRGIEKTWLQRPNRHLVPATVDQWWGPLRDITAALRHLRG